MADRTRDLMVEGAIRLLAARGVHGASLGQVLAETGAPRGSIYHHFPGGRNELFSEALDRTGRRHDRWIAERAGPTVQDVVAALLQFWRTVLVESDFESGCPILAVTVSAPNGALFQKAGAVFASSLEQLAALLADRGVSSAEAMEFATLMVAAAEGAVVLARAQHDVGPLDVVGAMLLGRARELDARVAS